jgi:hypothetical protein
VGFALPPRWPGQMVVEVHAGEEVDDGAIELRNVRYVGPGYLSNTFVGPTGDQALFKVCRPDESCLLAFGDDRTAVLRVLAPDGRYSSARWAPDGTRVVFITSSRPITVFEPATGTQREIPDRS